MFGKPDRTNAELLGLELEQEVEVGELGIEAAIARDQRIRVAIAAVVAAVVSIAIRANYRGRAIAGLDLIVA